MTFLAEWREQSAHYYYIIIELKTLNLSSSTETYGNTTIRYHDNDNYNRKYCDITNNVIAISFFWFSPGLKTNTYYVSNEKLTGVC